MTQFKVGDRIRYTGANKRCNTTRLVGSVGTVVRVFDNSAIVDFDIKTFSTDEAYSCMLNNIELLDIEPAPNFEFRNASDKTFKSLESEVQRTYVFPGGTVVIKDPHALNVSANGHRIVDKRGVSHYIPNGWFHLSWEVHPGKPHFDF